jgi:pyruvate dehydrogenase E1 component beta subunit
MISFNKAVDLALKKNLSKRKTLYFGLEVTNAGLGLKEKYPNQVYETPVSELATTGLVTGLALGGSKPMIVYGRVEFAMLAFDQIFTQTGRWNYSFGGKYICPASFRIQIGRQWGNGPQHTANYHSIFLQAYGVDVFIPSTPEEAYNYMLYINNSENPSIFLEHKYLSQISQKFKKKIKFYKPKNYKIYDSKDYKVLLITYADTLITALMARKILRTLNIDVSILNYSYFPFKERVSESSIKYIEKFNKIIFVDSAPKEFGILNGILGIASLISKKKLDCFFLSPPFLPCPSAVSLAKNYYINENDIVIETHKILNKKIPKLKKLSFEQKMLWPKYNINDLY